MIIKNRSFLTLDELNEWVHSKRGNGWKRVISVETYKEIFPLFPTDDNDAVSEWTFFRLFYWGEEEKEDAEETV